MALLDRGRATRTTHDRVRAAFVVALLIAGAAFANGVTGYEGTTMAVAEDQTDRPLADRHPVVYPADGVTVVATEGFPGHGESAGLAAFAPAGQPLYVDTSLDAYLAVEPDPDDDRSVRYAGMTTESGLPLYVVERVDLETGVVDRLHAEPAVGTDLDEPAAGIDSTDPAAGVGPDERVEEGDGSTPGNSNADDARTVQQFSDGGVLTVDTERNRVVERSPGGEVVWRADVVRPHDAVRLDVDPGAGPALGGADGGPDATESPPSSMDRPLDTLGQYTWAGLDGGGLGWLLDHLPYWVLAEDLPALALLTGSLSSWLLAEGWWVLRDRVHGSTP